MTEVRRFPVLGAGTGREDYAAPVLGPNAKEMRTENRSTTSNDNGVVAPVAPPNALIGVNYVGKFFTRGCRGMIESLQIYCQRTAAGVLQLAISPHPALGPLYTVTVTPGATWAWSNAVLENMWNYDSLFVWILTCNADVWWGADLIQPFDGHQSLDAGVLWFDINTRPYIRAVYSGETHGDVPVSGIINNIPIPSLTQRIEQAFSVNVPDNTLTRITGMVGAGVVVETALSFLTSLAPTAGLAPPAVAYILRIYADGVYAGSITNRQATQSEVAIFGRCAIGEFWQTTVADPAYDMTELFLRLPVQFRRSIELYANQTTGGAVLVIGHLNASLLM